MKKFLCVVLSLLCVLSFVGCAKQEINFEKLNEEEKQHYIETYLQKEYGVDECNVNQINVTDDTIFSRTKEYSANVSINGQNNIMVWIDNKGNITDNYFIKELNVPATGFFNNLIVSNYNDVCIFTEQTCFEKPTQDWSKVDLQEALKSDEITTIIRCFAPYKYVSTMNTFTSKICNLIDDYNVKIYFYFCENPNEIDINTYNLQTFSDSYTAR